MNRVLAFAALVAGVLAGEASFSLSAYPTYGTAASYAPAMTSSMSSTTAWETWPTTTSKSSATTSMSTAPSMITLSSVAHPLSSGMPASTMATHTVLVGGTDLVYTPPSLSGVNDKDTIIFVFLQVNHTLTQSSFSAPCNQAPNGLSSGFMPSNGSIVPFLLVEFSDPSHTGAPLWFYCAQADHCELGMRFSINSNNTQDAAWRLIDRLNTTSSTTIYTATTTSKPTTTSVAAPSIVTGTGTITNGACNCDCFCGFSAFPMGDGIGMMGGLPGLIPIASGPTMVGTSTAAPISSAAYGSGTWK